MLPHRRKYKSLNS